MARARPIHRPIVAASRGSFSGPSTTSAMPKITSISEKSIPNIARREAETLNVGRGLVAAACARLRRLGGDLREFSVLGRGALDLLGLILVLTVAHGLLEATECRAEVGSQ